MRPEYSFFLFFFFNDPATTEIYTLSLHDALPITTAGADAAGPAASEPTACPLPTVPDPAVETSINHRMTAADPVTRSCLCRRRAAALWIYAGRGGVTQDLGDDLGLGVGVVLDVGPGPRGQLAFGGGVELPNGASLRDHRGTG